MNASPDFLKLRLLAPLYQTGSDNFVHIYGECIFYQIAWRESPWNLITDSFPHDPPIEIVQFIIQPPVLLLKDCVKLVTFSLYGTIVLYIL